MNLFISTHKPNVHSACKFIFVLKPAVKYIFSFTRKQLRMLISRQIPSIWKVLQTTENTKYDTLCIDAYQTEFYNIWNVTVTQLVKSNLTNL